MIVVIAQKKAKLKLIQKLNITNLRQQVGILRSVLLYYGIPFRINRLSRFYAQFIQANDLCFDIGAHVGNHLRAWSNLGARIVGIEPQPHCMRLLQRWYGHHPHITLVEQAVGSVSGTRTLFISQCTPTISTLSRDWIHAIQQTKTFIKVQWDTALPITVTTLDTLIAQYGEPTFCKIDAEGYELEVLYGLSKAIPALSFEYIPAAINIALDCIERVGQLAMYEFNWSPGESRQLQSAVWLSPDEMAAHLTNIPAYGRSGDVYARRISS
ncbi:MAG: FkbM family methyltransferase [Desulfatiglandales bacterium]